MRRTHAVAKDCGSPIRTQEYREANVPILGEVLFAAELVLLHAAPLYYGLGIPRGDGSAVILLPAFLCPDAYLTPLHQWLARIGYKPFFSGIGFNTECPNLLIKQQLNATIREGSAQIGAQSPSGRSRSGWDYRSRDSRAAAIGCRFGYHLGCAISRYKWPTAAFCTWRKWFDAVSMQNMGSGVLPDCYTGHCTCDFLNSLRRTMPASVTETAVYSEGDGVVDWRYCKTDRAESDFSVYGTHLGLVFNPSVYGIVAERLAKAR